jgi:RND superfamily putative drug exporter
VSGLASLIVRRRISWVVLVLALLASIGILVLGGSQSSTATGATAALPIGAQSTTVVELQERLPASQTAPALIVFSRDGGSALTQADVAAITDRAQALSPLALEGQVPPPVVSDDGTVALVTAPLAASNDVLATADTVDQIRAIARDGLPDGIQAQVTGPAGFAADIAKVFDGANTNLLLATVLVVAILLIVTYRSPWLWIVPLVVVGLADRVAGVAAGGMSQLTGIPVDDAALGILSVLVFGAGTDYALLLISRYRDELRLEPDRYAAMRRALVGAGGAILGSGLTVILALLTLLLATIPTTRGLGLACAVGVLVALVYALVMLPVALVVFGRRLFWPFVPKVGDTPITDRRTVWSRIGAVVARRPLAVVIGGTIVLAVLALPLLGLRTGLGPTEQFLAKPEAVAGQETLARAFAAGAADPVAIISPQKDGDTVASLVATVPGVASVAPGVTGDGLAQTDVILATAPGSEAADQSIRDIRAALADVPDTYVGGPQAQTLDSAEAQQRDMRVIVPLILLLVFAVLILLLRALVAPVLLVVTVVGTYAAAMGASWWLFTNVFNFPAMDTGVPLLAFLFLVALGVDYNIFLVTRAKEEAGERGSKDGMLRALAATGGVITSAGILLAAVFAVLGVLPLIALAQIGLIVCIGVLLDTLLVRTVIVPALALFTGDRFWWPGHPPVARLGGAPQGSVTLTTAK